MKIAFSPPDITELEINAVVDTLKSGWITTGPKTKEFEKRLAQYCGTEKAVCLNSATACMELLLKILDIKEGDEVITSAYTYTASASIIHHVGAKIVLVDVAKDSYEMDFDKLEQAITAKTKAIISVDIAGVPCNYDKFVHLTERKKHLFVAANDIQKAMGRIAYISDSAHSLGASFAGKKVGGQADFTCFSFHAVKNLTTAEGGAVVWRNIVGIENNDIYQQFMLHSLHGQNKDALNKTQLGNWEYDIKILGHKCNMTDVAAAIGLAQLNRYDTILNRRKEIVNLYNSLLSPKVEVLNHFGDNYMSSCHLLMTRVGGAEEETRNKMICKLAENGISANVHYKPLPMHTAYKNLGFNIVDYPNSYNQYKNEITLPLHTLLTDNEVQYVVECFNRVLNEA